MNKIDKLLVFDLIGKFAHFRKFYTNSSSLSYSFPPRTTIIGMIAGILGYERDSYYEEFNIVKCKIAISIKTPIRKIMQTINYVRTKSIREFNLSAGHTQVPFEIVTPTNEKKLLRYRIYFYHNNDKIFQHLKKVLKNKQFYYPPYLGITEFIGDIDFISFINSGEISLIDDIRETVNISTVLNVKYLNNCELDFINEGSLQYEKEKMPLDFDKNRMITKVSSFVFEKNSKMIKLKNITFPVYNIKSDNVKENIVFLEGNIREN